MGLKYATLIYREHIIECSFNDNNKLSGITVQNKEDSSIVFDGSMTDAYDLIASIEFAAGFPFTTYKHEEDK